MQIVIDIPEDVKAVIDRKGTNETVAETLWQAVKNGTPLPKGHGRLIDADATLATAWTNFYKHEDEWEKKDNDYLPIGRMYDQNGFECCQQTIVYAPTIIEAESEDELDFIQPKKIVGKLISVDVLDKIRVEIERQEKWLLQAGCNTYNVDIAFDAIKSAVGRSDEE